MIRILTLKRYKFLKRSYYYLIILSISLIDLPVILAISAEDIPFLFICLIINTIPFFIPRSIPSSIPCSNPLL